MDYLELTINPVTGEEARSLLIAWLMGRGFDSFVEEEDSLIAYIPEGIIAKEEIRATEMPVTAAVELSWQVLREKNWNETWEQSYKPVDIAGRCLVRAPFHDPGTGFEYEIVIEPKMSFGTAHHETTALMIEQIMELDLKGKSVLDMGCGTAVLAILASMAGARDVVAVDNDRWAYENAIENVTRNGCDNIQVIAGDVQLLGKRVYDVILANINRNILLADIPAYAGVLRQEGRLVVSGFYSKDLHWIKDKADDSGLRYLCHRDNNNWTVASFKRD